MLATGDYVPLFFLVEALLPPGLCWPWGVDLRQLDLSTWWVVMLFGDLVVLLDLPKL